MSLKLYWWFMIGASFAGCCLAREISFTQIGDMKIYNDGKFLHCDDLVCPENGVKCILYKRPDKNDNKMLEVSKKCIDKDNNVVADDTEIVHNPDPGSHNSIYLESGGNGMVSTMNSSEARKLAEEIGTAVSKGIANLEKEILDSFRGF